MFARMIGVHDGHIVVIEASADGGVDVWADHGGTTFCGRCEDAVVWISRAACEVIGPRARLEIVRE